MSKMQLFIAIFLLATFSNALADPTEIRIMVVYSYEAQYTIPANVSGTHGPDDDSAVEYRANRMGELNEIFGNSGLDDEAVAVSSGPPVLMDDVYNENDPNDPKNNDEILEDVAAGNMTYDDGRSLEEIATEQGADIVIVVTAPYEKPNPQGVAQDIPTSTAGDSGAWIITDAEFAGPGNWGHEIGHLGGVRHPSDTSGNIEGDRGFQKDDEIGRFGDIMMSESVCDIYLSDPANEGKTCEIAQQYSDKDTDYIDSSGANRGKLGNADQDATRVLEQTLPAIGGYAEERAEPPPPPTPITWINNHFVYCHQPSCALWDMRGDGGAGATIFNIKRAFSANGTYTTVQTETSINYFNVHGGDQNMYWKICGLNEGGETCSPSFRTRIECEVGGGGLPF